MKKLVAVLMVMGLAACTQERPIGDPGPPPKPPVIITKEVPVPVLCQAKVTEQQIDINSVDPTSALEDQNAALRATVAQQQVEITDLESALIGCGGTVTKAPK
jgi:hypothetical protein